MTQVVVTTYKADQEQYVAALEEMEDANRDVEKAEEGVEKQGKKSFDETAKGTKKVSKGFDGLSKKLGNLALGFAAAFSIQRIVGGAFQTIKEFDTGLAELSSITGIVGDELDGLGSEAIRLSLKFGTSATDIIKGMQLVKSAMAELDPEGIVEVTEQADILAKAAGLDLPTAVENLTQTMNQFQLSASEAANTVDILATSQQKGTATVSQLSESLKNVGSVANAAGISLSDTTVAIQGLAKGGILGAEAGTKLRGTILRLQKAGIGFVDGQFDLQAAIAETEEKFKSIVDPIELAKEKGKLFGEENVATIDTLIAQREVMGTLTEQMGDLTSAEDQAITNTETLAGAQDKLGATYDAFILSIDSGEGVISNFFKSAIDGATDFLNVLLRVEEEGVGGLFQGLIETAPQFEQFANLIKLGNEAAIAGGEEAVRESRVRLNTMLSDAQAELQKALAEGEGLAAQAAIAQIGIIEEGLKELTVQRLSLERTVVESQKGTFAELTKEQEKQVEEERKLREERQKVIEAAGDELAKIRIENEKAARDAVIKEQEEGIDQELALLDSAALAERDRTELAFQEKIDAVEGNSENEIALRTALEQQLVDELLAIDDEFFEKQQDAVEKNNKELEKTRQDGIKEAIDNEELLFKAQELFITQTAENDQIATDLRLQNEIDFLERKKEIFEESATAEEDFAEEILDIDIELAEKQREQQEKEAELDEEARQRRLDIQRGLLQASLDLLTTFGAKNIGAAKIAAVAQIAIARGEAIAQLVKDVQTVGITPIEKAILFATGFLQITAGIVQAQQALEGFKEGVIDYQGKGTETSDSNVIRISKHESVIKAKATRENKDALLAINDGTFDKHVYDNYVLPAMGIAIKERKESERTSFAESVGASMLSGFNDKKLIGEHKTDRSLARELNNNLIRAIKRGNRSAYKN